ncbi:L,D-transpeptidase [Luteolibacter sp. LG18]|uniref:L,D-transpeptidase n=1 Tax=Luteolibacter sp. LG18 TaxID=2819286 RepID=UPI002B317B33|nr:murein L,D-transpeptidase [Luteolibacter sp. LG18]
MIRRFAAILPLLLSSALSAQEPERPVLKAIPVDIEELPQVDPSSQKVAPNAPAPVAAKPLPALPTTPTPPSADGKPTGDDAVRVQIFLDQALFGPGVIDGKPGRFSELAMQAWNEVHGHPIGDWTTVLAEAHKTVPNPFAVAVVPDVVKDWLDTTLPNDHEGQAKRKRMSYRSVIEFMAERYHTSDEYLAVLNPGKNLYNLKARDSLVVPNVKPFAIELITGKKYEAEPAMSARHVVVDTKINQVRIFEAAPAALVVSEKEPDGAVKVSRPNRGLVASFPITPGQPKFIKYGIWELKNCLELPYWRYDKSLLETGVRSSESINIPPGPNSPVGILWAGLSKPGIGMHGTGEPETIGRARSHGCIRLANWDAIRLPTVIRPGASVEIR